MPAESITVKGFGPSATVSAVDGRVCLAVSGGSTGSAPRASLLLTVHQAGELVRAIETFARQAEREKGRKAG